MRSSSSTPVPDEEWVGVHLILGRTDEGGLRVRVKSIATAADVSRTSAYLCAHCEEVESFDAGFGASR